MTVFKLNETLKELCIGMGASRALTQYFKSGVPIIPEPFLETVIDFPKSTKPSTIALVFQLIVKYKFIFDEQYYCTEPLLEEDYENNTFRIVYSIFLEDKSFNDKLNFLPKLP